MHESQTTLALLIPCYNSAHSVESVIGECRGHASAILAVNDGSLDETPEILAKLGVETIGWRKNQGKGAALRAGFEHLLKEYDFSYVITMDSDGQHRPSEIPILINKQQQSGADLVIGARRFERAEMPALRYWSNVISSGIIGGLFGSSIRDFQCGFRLFSREAVETMLPGLSSTAFSIETEMVLAALSRGLSVAEAEISSIYSEESTRRSAWRPLTDSWQIAKVTANYWLRNRFRK